MFGWTWLRRRRLQRDAQRRYSQQQKTIDQLKESLVDLPKVHLELPREPVGRLGDLGYFDVQRCMVVLYRSQTRTSSGFPGVTKLDLRDMLVYLCCRHYDEALRLIAVAEAENYISVV